MVYTQTRICPKEWDEKIRSDFVIQTDHLISARRPDLMIIKKKKRTCHLVIFAVSADLKIKRKTNENIDKYLDLARELKKAAKHEGDGDTNCCWNTWNGSQKPGKRTEKIRDQSKNRDHPDHSTVKIKQDTWKVEKTLCQLNFSEKSSVITTDCFGIR